MADQQAFGQAAEQAFNTEPRCPCVLVIDVSGSMGEIVANSGKDLGYTIQQDGQTYRAVSGGITRIDGVNEGLRTYQADLLSDSLAAQRVEVSVITFGSTVETVVPFVGAQEFQPPTLTYGGETMLGTAVLRAIDALTERKRLHRQNAILLFRPWLVLITDGTPTDSWQEAAARIKEGEANKSFSFFPIGVERANYDILRQMSPARAPIALTGNKWREMFLWLSASQRSVSHSNPGQEGGVSLPSPAGWGSIG